MKIYHLLVGFFMDVILISVPFSILYSIPANSFWIEYRETLQIVSSLAVLWYLFGIGLLTLLQNREDKKPGSDVDKSGKSFKNTDRINIFDSSGQLRLSLRPQDLLYFESADNYVIVYFRKNMQVGKELVRNSLKNLETDLVGYNCIRCHRSFIVNLLNVSSIKKRGRAYEIEIEDISVKIPISRGYVKSVQSSLQE